MTTPFDPSEPSESVPELSAKHCPHCDVRVPDAPYCGACGAHLATEHPAAAQRSARRLHSFSAFPDEPVIHLSTVSSLFPQLSARAKVPFRVALVAVVSLIVALAAIGADAPLIAVCALAVPLLFLLYLWEVDPFEGSFLLPTFASVVVGAGLGAGWALIGSHYVDQALLPLVGTSLTGSHDLLAAVVVPAAGQLLMGVPMLLVWLSQRGTRESLDGFASGASGALGFTAAATITLMAPWFSTGQLVHEPFLTVFTQALLHGVSVPLVSALTTGLFAACFWATTGERDTAAREKWATSATLALALGLLLQIGLGFCDVSVLPDGVVIAIHLVAIALSIVLVRIGIHFLLLHEASHVAVGPPVVCAHCGHVVPRMLFCPNCGVAERALSRAHHPRHTPTPETDHVDDPAWPLASDGQVTAPVAFSQAPAGDQPVRPKHRRMVVLLVVGLGLLSLVFVLVAFVVPAGPPAPCRPFNCQGPPVGHGDRFGDAALTAVQSGVSYRNHQGFSLRYQGTSSNPAVSTSASGLTLTYRLTTGDKAEVQVIGHPAGGESAQAIVTQIVKEVAPGAQVAYQLPGALVGYQPGYGEALNLQPASSDGSTGTIRLIVMAAVRGDFGIAVVAEGPLLPTVTPKSRYWDGHPSPANVAAAYVADPVINSITFPNAKG